MTEDARAQDAAAWSDFWAKNTASGANGCLPERWAAIEEAQKQAWHGFIADLPEGARVLDLATGDGRVLRWMREARPDLVLEGIDLAPDLPPAPEGTKIQGGVEMEFLPFDDSSFDAVVSQFGFEYGDTSATAAEIVRVLKPRGAAGLMVHRGDGPILEHNLARQTEIGWVLDEVNAADAVRKALNTPGAGAGVAAQVAAALAILGEAKFGSSSPAWEIPEALRRACIMGEKDGLQSVEATITAITDQAANEIGRIRSLSGACGTADNRPALIAVFGVHGMGLRETTEVREPSGRALADFLLLG